MELINTFVQLGERMKTLVADEPAIIGRARVENPWFTEEMVKYSCLQWADILQEKHIQGWLKGYKQVSEIKKVGIIMAGNIPFVGLHDLLSAVASGNCAICKLSSQDKVLMKWIILTLHQFSS